MLLGRMPHAKWVVAMSMHLTVLLCMPMHAGCQDGCPNAPVRHPVGKLTPRADESVQGFGHAVCADGNDVAVGALVEGEDVSKKVRLFDLPTASRTACVVLPERLKVGIPLNLAMGDGWVAASFIASRLGDREVLAYRLTDPNRMVSLRPTDDNRYLMFACSVAVDGAHVVAGASIARAGGGVAYLFRLKDGRQVRRFVSPASQKGNTSFGCAVAMSRKYVVVGAKTAQVDGKEQAGLVHIYNRKTGKYLRKVASPDPTSNAFFGAVLAVAGDHLVVGEPQSWREDRPGNAYVYDLGAGKMLGELRVARETDRSDNFGSSIDVADGLVVIGAPGGSPLEGESKAGGAAYLFDLKTRKPLAKLLPEVRAAGTLFGRSVAIARQRIVVGEPTVHGEKKVNEKGVVHVFKVPPKMRSNASEKGSSNPKGDS